MQLRHNVTAAKLLRAGSALLPALVLSTSLLAQTDNASVSGTIKDPTGAVVPGARIVLTEERTGFERRTTTNESGLYVFTSIPPGDYSISVEAAGFKTITRTNNRILPSGAAGIDITLEIGGTTETVQVTASASDVLPDNGALGKEVDRTVVENTPLSGRNAMYLALLVPGVTGEALNTLNYGMTGAGYTSINGAPPQDIGITFDGANGFRTRGGGWITAGSPDIDAIQEVLVLTSTYSAEYGRAASGQIRLVTRGGGRDFHASFYENVQNTAFNANSWLRNRSPDPAQNSVPAPLHFNQFGYNVNGPVYIPGKWNTERNKMFFFFSQEFVRHRLPAQAVMTVPSAAMRKGDFSELLVPGNPFYRNGQTIKDPLTGTPFPDNIIPESRLSHNGLGLLNAYPAPSSFQAGFNWTKFDTNIQDQHKETYSFDYNPGSSHAIRFRGQQTVQDQYQPLNGGSDRTPLIYKPHAMSGSVNYTWTINPTTINEFHASASNFGETLDMEYALADRTLYGINYPYIFPGTKAFENKIPTVTMDLFTQLDGNRYPLSNSGTTYRVSNNVTKLKGNHTIKAGYLFEKIGQNDNSQITFGANIPGGTNNLNGRFTFTPLRGGAPTTGVAISNAAMGMFDTYAEFGGQAYTPYRGYLNEWFIQDGWKVTPKLRLEFGLRHSITSAIYSLWNNMILFDRALYDPSKRVVQDPKTGYILSGEDYNGMVIPGSGWPDSAKGRVPAADSGQYNHLFRGYPRGFADPHSNFQPRFGIAYQIGRGQVVRAGGGRFIIRAPISDGVFLGGQAPFQPQVSVLNGSVDQPGAGGKGVRFPTQVYTEDRSYPQTEAYNWNVTYSRAAPMSSMLEVSYVGRRSLHVLTWANINQLPLGTTYANPGVSPNYLRPYGGYYSILEENPSGTAMYHGLQLSWNRRARKSLTWGVSYTYSASWDDGSRTTAIYPDAFNRRANWARSNFDSPQVLVVSYIYELPFFKTNQSLLGKLAGGWAISGVSQFQDGRPLGVTTADDFAGVGPGGGAQYWTMKGDPFLSKGERAFSNRNNDGNYWFRTTNPDGTPIFVAPALGTFSQKYSRNFVPAPGFQNWNIAGTKNFRLTERQSIYFRCEAFNWINHPNWAGPNLNPRAVNFGQIQSKTSNRVLQLSARYSF